MQETIIPENRQTAFEAEQKQYFEQCKQHPTEKEALNIAAGYLFFENNREQCFRYIKNAVKTQTKTQNTKHKKEIFDRVEMLLEQKRDIAALHHCMQLLNVKQHDPNALFNLAKAFYKQEAYKEAIIVLKKLFTVFPTNLFLIEYLGVCYDKIAFTKDAIKIFEHGIAVHKTHSQFYFNLGALYEKVHAWHNAAAAFQHAIKHNYLLTQPLKQQLQQRIIMLKNRATGQHAHYNITIGTQT